MIKVMDIFAALDKWAPFDTQLSFDNAGLLVGDMEAEVTGVMTCLDISADVAAQAEVNYCNLIVSHHPVIFSAIKAVRAGDLPYILVKKEMSAICAHTNLDAADGGVNDLLSGALELENIEKLDLNDGEDTSPLGRIGNLRRDMSAGQFAAFVKSKLNCGGARYTSFGGNIRRVAVCGGSGADFLEAAKAAGADALVTGEAKHHELLLAGDIGICLVDGGHFCTEHMIAAELARHIGKEFDIPVFEAEEKEPVLYV